LLLLTAGTGAACSLYCLLVFSLEVHPHILDVNEHKLI
jgi:hypothetical protein